MPEERFYELSLDQAANSGARTVAVFSTPAFCRTVTCGPMLDQVKAIARDHPNVNFVHVEIYTGFNEPVCQVGCMRPRTATPVRRASNSSGQRSGEPTEVVVNIDRARLLELIDQGAQIVDVLPDATRPDIPTAAPDEKIGTVRHRTVEAGCDEALVIDCDGLVMGRLRGSAWDADDHLTVDKVMDIGPTTVRPDGSLHSLLERMDKRGTSLVVVSDPQRLSTPPSDRARRAGFEAPHDPRPTCDWTRRSVRIEHDGRLHASEIGAKSLPRERMGEGSPPRAGRSWPVAAAIFAGRPLRRRWS